MNDRNMSGLRIICPICTEEFQADAEIHITSCGHLYHLVCMRQWQSRSTSCPQCREQNPTTHKVFINFEEHIVLPTAPQIELDLQAKLESSVDKINELQAQLQESELNFLQIQEQFTNEQDIRKEMQRRVDQCNDNESNFLHLHAQYSEMEGRLNHLKEENERLAVENEYKTKEFDSKAAEILTIEGLLASTKEEMQQRIDQSKDNESNFLQLHAQYSEMEERFKHLKEENERLTVENDYKAKELDIKAAEILTIEGLLAATKKDSSNKALKLEKSMKKITDDFVKEISNCTQRTVHKINLDIVGSKPADR